MKLGEVPLASCIEQALDPVEVEKESIAAAARKEFDAFPSVMVLGAGPNETSPSEMIFFPTASAERDSKPFRHEHVQRFGRRSAGSENT